MYLNFFLLPSSSVKAPLLLYLSGRNIKTRFLFTNLTSFRQKVVAILRISKRFEISLLERREMLEDVRLYMSRSLVFEQQFETADLNFRNN